MSTRHLAILASIILLTSSISLITPIQAHLSSTSIPQPVSAANFTASIYYPRSTDPVFVTPGGSFKVYLNYSIDQGSLIAVAPIISTAFEPIVDQYMPDYLIDNQTETTYIITATIPANVSVELYNLTIICWYGNGTDDHFTNITQPRAVDVISSYKDTFTFIQLSDLHVGSYRGTKGHPLHNINNNDLLQAIKEVNLLHPDFVVISGDLVHGQVYHNEYSHEYPLLYDILQKFDVPTFICPGNHDGYNKPGEDGKAFWTQYFGPDYYSFNYGPYHFQMLDSFDFSKLKRATLWFAPLNWGGAIQDAQLTWIQHDLAANTQSPLTFMVLHHPPLLNTTKDSLVGTPYINRDPLLSLIKDYGVDMVLAGHTHWDNITIQNGTVFVTTTTTSGKPDDGHHAYQGYRQIFIDNGTIGNYNYQDPQNSTPIYKLSLTQNSPTSVTIHNKQIRPVTLLIRFTVPLGSYKTSIGTIIQTRSNATANELYVQATIDAKSNQIVRLTKS